MAPSINEYSGSETADIIIVSPDKKLWGIFVKPTIEFFLVKNFVFTNVDTPTSMLVKFFPLILDTSALIPTPSVSLLSNTTLSLTL